MNIVVALAPGATVGIDADGGKHDVVGQALSFGVGKQSMTKSCGLVPALWRVSVTLLMFCAGKMAGENPVSSTVRSKVTLTPMTPSASSGRHVPLVALPHAFVPTNRSAR